MGILDGKAVVITGAGRGLGEAYAMHAALAGASVVVNDNDGDLAERVAEHIRGYGHVKERHLKDAKAREAVLLARLRDGAQQATATAKVPVAAD